jgi:hypothetical protein
MAEKKKSKKKSDKDLYTSRNEFKEGFYDQPDKPPITPETYYGTASGKTMFDADMTSPDDIMLNYKKGGIAKGCGKIMSDRRKKTKMY